MKKKSKSNFETNVYKYTSKCCRAKLEIIKITNDFLDKWICTKCGGEVNEAFKKIK